MCKFCKCFFAYDVKKLVFNDICQVYSLLTPYYIYYCKLKSSQVVKKSRYMFLMTTIPNGSIKKTRCYEINTVPLIIY